MNLLKLLDGQNIRICNHHRGCGIPNDINDPAADVHLHKEPNHGKNFHGDIHIPLNGTPTAEISKEINSKLSSKQLREIQNRLIEEINDAFKEEPNDSIKRQDFIHELADLLKNNWNDKLSSEERARDIARRLALAFGLGEEVENILRRSNNGQILQYTSIYQMKEKNYFVTICMEDIKLGEVSGKMKTKYINK